MDVYTEQNYCKRCGEQYDPDEQVPPKNASFYWVPHCPFCNAKFTATPADELWIRIVSDSLHKFKSDDYPEYDPDSYDETLDRIQGYARLIHGRMVNTSSEKLIEMAKFFDSRQKHNRFTTRKHHNIAFELRKQAREMLDKSQ